MKHVLIMTSMLAFMLTGSLQAQRVVWQDDFETSKGWSEYENDKGSAVVKEGVLKIKSKEGQWFISKCKTNLNGNKDFTISVDVNAKLGIKQDRYIGLIIDYNDQKNFTAFFVEKGFVRFEQYKDGVMVRTDWEPLKNRSRSESKHLTFVIQRKGQNVLFIVNDEEALDIDGINVQSNRIGLIVTGEQEVSFDNVKISQ